MAGFRGKKNLICRSLPAERRLLVPPEVVASCRASYRAAINPGSDLKLGWIDCASTVLDAAAEQVFDDITKMAADVCQTPRMVKKLVEFILPSTVFDVDEQKRPTNHSAEQE